MVDLALLQSISYIAGALGVCVAAVYYVINLRTTLHTRRISMAQNIVATTTDVETMKRYFTLLSYEWSDYDDFEKKYGSENNLESAAIRYAIWDRYNAIGAMVRKGIVRVEDVIDAGAIGITWQWAKYKPIIEESRRRYNGKNWMRDFEFLAVESLKYIKANDPSYVVPEKLDKYVPNG
jgi:hypothetical protein